MPAWLLRPRAALFPPVGRVEAPPAAAFAATFARTVEKNRGRLERRTLETTSIVTASGPWPGLRQGFRLRREITCRGKTTVEIVHGITSLTPEQASAAALLQATREHWQVENGLHYVRDVTLGEDACRVRTGQAAQRLAAGRNVVICLLHRLPDDSAAAAIQRLAARPHEALALLNSQF
jgi:hypothetical protein